MSASRVCDSDLAVDWSQVFIQPVQRFFDQLGPWNIVSGVVYDMALVLGRGAKESEHRLLTRLNGIFVVSNRIGTHSCLFLSVSAALCGVGAALSLSVVALTISPVMTTQAQNSVPSPAR